MIRHVVSYITYLNLHIYITLLFKNILLHNNLKMQTFIILESSYKSLGVTKSISELKLVYVKRTRFITENIPKSKYNFYGDDLSYSKRCYPYYRNRHAIDIYTQVRSVSPHNNLQGYITLSVVISKFSTLDLNSLYFC